MTDLASMDLGNMSQADKHRLSEAMQTSLDYVLKVEYSKPLPPDTPPSELVGLSLKHNAPKEARAIIMRYHISQPEAKRFMALYRADYDLYQSDIVQPSEIGPRLFTFNGAPPEADSS